MTGRQVPPSEARHCKTCDRLLVRRRYSKTGRLEDREAFMDRQYCDKRCAPGRVGIRRREYGRCDLAVNHYPATLHLLVNITGQGIWSKITWPFDEQDPDVKRYLAIADAYEEEDNRRLAAQASS